MEVDLVTESGLVIEWMYFPNAQHRCLLSCTLPQLPVGSFRVDVRIE